MFFRKATIAILLILCSVSLPAQSPPVAGVVVDSVGLDLYTPWSAFDVFLTNTAQNADTIEYYFYEPGQYGFPLTTGIIGTSVTNPSYWVGVWNSNCQNYEVRQIVKNPFGTDTVTVPFQMGCNCLTVPPTYSMNVTMGQGGNFQACLNLTEFNGEAKIQWTGCAAGNWCCNGTLPYPGFHTICGLLYNGTCHATTYQQVCTTILVPCWDPSALFAHTQSGSTFSFFDNSSGIQLSAWNWDFGDGATDTVPNPVHTYGQSGTYQVCLTVTDSCGTNTHCETINVEIVSREEALAAGLTVNPNPTKGSLQVMLEGQGTQPVELVLMDLQGKTVLRDHWEAGELSKQYILDGFASGIYQLKVAQGEFMAIRRVILLPH